MVLRILKTITFVCTNHSHNRLFEKQNHAFDKIYHSVIYLRQQEIYKDNSNTEYKRNSSIDNVILKLFDLNIDFGPL